MDKRDLTNWDESTIEEIGRKALVVPCDISQEKHVKKLTLTVSEE